MKKLNVFVGVAMALGLSLTATSCFDDSHLVADIDNLTNRVQSLEDWQQTVNSEITTIKGLISALEEKNFITTVEENAEGYIITLQNGEVLTIKNGKDGKEGHSPEMGVALKDGVYYWTVDGQFMLDNNDNKIPVTGAAGENGVTPQIRISDNGYWSVSYNNGQDWEFLTDSEGDKISALGTPGATGPQGPQGDSFFESVTTSKDGKSVEFKLADGTAFSLPIVKALAFKAESGVSYFDAGKGVAAFIVTVPAEYEALTAKVEKVDAVALRSAGTEPVFAVTIAEDGEEQVKVTVNYESVVGSVNYLLTITMIEKGGNTQSVSKVLSFVAADEEDVVVGENQFSVRTAGELALALDKATDNATIELAEGAYNIPASARGKTVSFVGTSDAADVVVSCKSADIGALNASSVTFENVTIESQNVTYNGFTHVVNSTYKNCIINNQYTLYSDGGIVTFEGCTFNVTGDYYNLWTWGASATFTDCTFNCDAKAVLVYGGTPESTVTFNNCTFNDSGALDKAKAAIETGDDYSVKYNIIINQCTVNGFSVTEPHKNLGGDNYGTNVWGNKDLMTSDNLSVVVDGTRVY